MRVLPRLRLAILERPEEAGGEGGAGEGDEGEVLRHRGRDSCPRDGSLRDMSCESRILTSFIA